jgi:hypothetical protein
LNAGSEGLWESDIRAFEANVSGKSAIVSFCAGFAASDEVPANGFDEPLDENRLDEKGFALLPLPAVDVPPNSWLPMLDGGVDALISANNDGDESVSFACGLEILLARTPRTLPSLRRHVFLRQPKRYNLRS